MPSRADSGIYYFLGNITSHITHALPLHRELGGTFVVTSLRSMREIQKNYNVPVICLDDVPYAWKKGRIRPIRQHEYIKLNHRHRATINFLETHARVVIFYELFEFDDSTKLHLPRTIFLTHGNMLKNYLEMYPRRIEIIQNQYDYMAAIGPYMKASFLSSGIPAEKLVDIGIARSDDVVALRHKTTISPSLECIGISKQRPVISYLPTFWGDSSVASLGLKIAKNTPKNYQLLIRLHPQTTSAIIRKYRRLRNPNVYLLKDSIGLLEVLGASDIIVGDLSSVMLEAILLDKPLIFVETQTSDASLRNTQLGAIQHYSPTITAENIHQLNSIFQQAIEHGVDAQLWDRTKKQSFYNASGGSAKAIAKFIRSLF